MSVVSEMIVYGGLVIYARAGRVDITDDMQEVAAGTVVARLTAGTGPLEEVTLLNLSKALTTIITRTTTPDASELTSSQAILWLDDTNGAAKLMVKAKTANGTVVTGNIPLS